MSFLLLLSAAPRNQFLARAVGLYTSNKSYSIISCGFSINLVHREIGDLAKDQRIARERRVTMGFRELRRYGVKFRIEIFRTLTGVILLSMGR